MDYSNKFFPNMKPLNVFVALIIVMCVTGFFGAISGFFIAYLSVPPFIATLAMMIMNQLISMRVSRPLRKLNDSIKDMEAGNLHPRIYIGGSTEVRHLGSTLQTSLDQITQLMQDIVVEQEEKRKSEMDALQSQINPHFLYNTLDSIVWMIEGERYDDAVFMITQLASLFRVSLSKGKTIIPLEDELRHGSRSDWESITAIVSR